MKDINKMRLGVLREIKQIHEFFDMMEKSVKSRNEYAIEKAYMFIVHLVYMMDKGCLNPKSIALDLEVKKALIDQDAEEDKANLLLNWP